MPYEDPEQQKQAQREWYERNRIKVVEASRKQKAKNKAWLRKLKEQPCFDCGVEYPYYVTDYHHLDPTLKTMSVGRALVTIGRKKVEEEIAKCILLCANCHREREHGIKDDDVL